MSLEISDHIVPQNWMRAEETVRLFDALQGGLPLSEPQALFVGGCVRNALLGEAVEDYDIATPLPPDAVTEILTAQDIKVIPTGIDHGTVTAVLGGTSYEITTLRRDEDTDGRHARVAYTDSWVEDAKRRDFTMNTLLLDRQGNVYDPLGTGLDDLRARHVRFVGEAARRIEEDYLRILRFFRFSALYGNGFDEEGLAACKAGSAQIDSLSRERVTQEVFKIMTAEAPQEVFSVMFEHDILTALHFDAYDPEFFGHFCMFQTRYGLTALAPRLFVFAGLNFENIQAMERYILFPKVFLQDMRCIYGSLALPDLSRDTVVRESVYRFGRSVTAQALMIEVAQDRVMNGYAPKAIEVIQTWDVPTFPVSGHDVMQAGVQNGPAIGEALEFIENWWISMDFAPSRDGCLERLRAYLKDRPSHSSST